MALPPNSRLLAGKGGQSSLSSGLRCGGLVSLAVGRTNPGAGAATDTSALVIHHHNLLLDLIVFVVEIDKIALLVDALQHHDVATANL